MSTVTVLGSCSGTEPMAGRHHTSLLLQVQDSLYFLDAGESCAYTAHVSGFDLLKSRALFLTHPHLDHTGGMLHLFWTLGKLSGVRKEKMTYPFAVYAPVVSQIRDLIRAGVSTEFGAFISTIPVHPVQDGLLYEDENIHVEALHNTHMGIPEEPQAWRSFSYRITTCEGKKIILSGDVREIGELETFFAEDSELLFMESGHHDPLEVCTFLKEKVRHVPGKLCFYHHGRQILGNPRFYETECRKIFGDNVIIADDGTEISL